MAGKYLNIWDWRTRVPHMFASCLLARLILLKKFSAWVYWKVFCCFWPIKLPNLSHKGEGAAVGVHFHVQHCLLTFIRSNFFKLKAKCSVFNFMDLDQRIVNLTYLKISKKGQNLCCFWKLFSLNPLHNFGIMVQIY